MLNPLKSLVLLFSFFITLNSLHAQSLEPRLYSNAPIDLNFLVIGYGYSQGALPSTQDLPLQDPQLNLNIGVVAFARGFELLGKSAKFNILLPFATLDGSATINNEHRSRKVSGLGDIKASMSVNLFGSPALKLKDFATFKQDTIVGVSLQVTAPTGQYDESKILNIGQNIWSAKLGLGVSKALDNFTVEFLSDATFYTKNSNFYGSKKETNPIYSVQAHLIYNFQGGIWIALNSNYYWGGNTFLDDVSKETQLSNSRLGAVLALPINKKNSIKINGSNGISTRTGTNFATIMMTWQYRFGGGL